MEEIQYKKLDADCFNTHSLDSFVRHQAVTECWREVDNKWVLVPNPFVLVHLMANVSLASQPYHTTYLENQRIMWNWSVFKFQRNIVIGALEENFLQ